MSTTEDKVDGASADDIGVGGRTADGDVTRQLPRGRLRPHGGHQRLQGAQGDGRPRHVQVLVEAGLPVVASHKGPFLIALILSFVGLVLQVADPPAPQ